MQSREQKYAHDIYVQVYEVWARPKDFQTQYGSMAHKLPVLVRTAGLAQALAFVDARGKEAAHQLLDHLANVVLGNNSSAAALCETSRTASLGDYMHLTERVMLALKWYKRFAQSVLDVEAGEGED